jgi:hypothetical protein
MAVIHDAVCCREWETGQASAPARAGSFRQAAARWGTTWPEQRQRPAADAESKDSHLQVQREAEQEAETS